VENKKGVGKGTGGNRKSLMKKHSAGGGGHVGQYAVDTYIRIYRELGRARYK